MNKRNKDESERLIEDFLTSNPTPTAADWKRLIDSNPQFAGEIAEAALAHSPAMNDNVGQPFNEALYNSTVSAVLNLVHTTPSPVLQDAEKKVHSIQGPEARKVAIEIGIGPYASLLSGILVGRTSAPSWVLSALSSRLNVPFMALSELFHRSFSASVVPAFKATEGQPQVATEPMSWKGAVKAMKLSPEETARLLELGSED